MRHFLQIFFGLLIPLSALFIALATGYFLFEYDFSKAVKLAMITGVVIGFGVSFIGSLVILILRAGRQPKILTVKESRKKRKKEAKIQAIEELKEEDNNTQDPDSLSNFITQNFILLMDKRLAFEITNYAIIARKMTKKGHHSNFEEGILSVKTIHEFIKINISSLTKHTVKISMEYKRNSTHAPVILEYLKETEVSFLDYQ